MVKRLVIFLFLYAAGVAVSPLFARADDGLKAIGDSTMETGLDELGEHHKWPGLDLPGPLPPALVTNQIKPSSLSQWSVSKCPLVQSDRVFQRPLFLLFHSFVFYELI